MVKAYDNDELASDSDDEKQLLKPRKLWNEKCRSGNGIRQKEETWQCIKQA